MLFCFVFAAFSATERAIPSFWLNNWDSTNPIIAFWNTAQLSWTVDPSMHPGINHLRAYNDMERDVVTSDSFALKVDDVIYGNDMLFNNSHLSGCVQEVNGELWTLYDRYGNETMPVSVHRAFYLPPNEEFYVIKYTIKSNDGNAHTVKLLDYLVSGKDQTWSTGSCSGKTCVINRDDAKIASIAILTDAKHQHSRSVGNGDFSSNDNHLTQFNASGTVPIFNEYKQESVSFGAVYNIQISPSKPVVISTTRAFGRSSTDAINHLTTAMALGTEALIKLTNDRYASFLAKGVQPSLTGDALDFYQKSILTLKASQNPYIGTVASSLHPKYGYKNWMRDSLMAAFMLDAAGYHDEAKKFFNWVPKAPLDNNGGFHTTYSALTGEYVGFVEPQYDSVGLYLVAMNYRLKSFGDKDFVKANIEFIRKMEDFTFKNSGFHNLPLSDRSPWEESTDHHTGEDIPQQFYAFEVGCLYGGMMAAHSIELEIGDSTRAEKCLQRAKEIKQGAKEALWDSENKRLYRGVWDDNDKKPDLRADSASMTCVFFGLLEGEEAKSHLNYITSKLTKLKNGIARYEGDPYFYDSIWNPCSDHWNKIYHNETQVGEPAWPVVTAYVAWSEHLLGIDIQPRLDWMVEIAAYGNMPIGEAVDSKDGSLIVPSAPDCFEHAGVYVYTVLLKQNKVRSLISTF